MEGIALLRRAVEDLVNQKQGKDSHHPRHFQGQLAAEDFVSLIGSLPVDFSRWYPLQDSVTGQFLFVADAAFVDGGDPIG